MFHPVLQVWQIDMNLNCDASVMLELVNSLASLKDLQRDIIKTEMNDDAPWVWKKGRKNYRGHTQQELLHIRDNECNAHEIGTPTHHQIG